MKLRVFLFCMRPLYQLVLLMKTLFRFSQELNCRCASLLCSALIVAHNYFVVLFSGVELVVECVFVDSKHVKI